MTPQKHHSFNTGRGNTSRGNILAGLFLLARGHATGMDEFANTPNALTAAIAPMIAFPLVGALLLAVDGNVLVAITAFLSRLCVVLALTIITYEFAHFMRRDSNWLRTAAVLNWSFWLVLPLLLLAMFIGAALVTAGVPQQPAEIGLLALAGLYLMWFHWFTVRTGLELTKLQALALVLITNIILGLLALGPDAINLAIQGQLHLLLTPATLLHG